MANLLKLKVGIAAVSISIIIMIPLMESNFNAPVRIKRWSALTWDDFQGFVRPFSTYEAVISSDVYLDYDSTSKSYRAYAGQHNVASWAKMEAGNSDYLLGHEQYHFNITEVHARKMNRIIRQYPGKRDAFYLGKLMEIRNDLYKMQEQYDRETNHSTIFNKQRRWEFKIDSMLMLDSGWMIDPYSGARIFFPSQATFQNGVNADPSPYRYYTLSKYAMSFFLISFQNPIYEDELFSGILENYKNSADTVKFSKIEHTDDLDKITILLRDSSSVTSCIVWLHRHPYLYKLAVRYPNANGDTTGYQQNAASFINSFSIVDTDTMWLRMSDESTSPITLQHIIEANNPDKENENMCFRIGSDSRIGFYRGPIFDGNGSLLLAMDFIADNDSLHYEDILMVGNSVYSYEPSAKGQIYYVPAENLPKDPSVVKFGYLLKKDSAEKCYQFLHEALMLNPR